jgi:peptide-methionine (S)-S-oxide reductase
MRNHLLKGAVVMAIIFGTSCATSVATGHLPAPATDIPLGKSGELRTAVFAGGCFWCTEAVFQQIPGVVKVVSGYAGGDRETADYETVSTGRTDHAESIQITYAADKVTYGRLLQVFFSTHDPMTLNRQGPDAGRQYRSAIFYADDGQKRVADAYVRQLTDAKAFSKPIVTTFEPLKDFYPAEVYHQDYAHLNPFQPYIQRYAIPKAQKAKAEFGVETRATTRP